MARKAKKEMQVQEFKKSNNLINTAYGRTSAMSYKLFALGMLNARIKNDYVVSDISITDLKKYLQGNRHDFNDAVYSYTVADIDGKKQTLMDWKIVVRDIESGKFHAVSVIPSATFDPEVGLHLTFNHELTSELINMKENYTLLRLDWTLKLKSPFSIRLYEMAKSKLDYERAILIKRKKDIKEYTWRMHPAELGIKIGAISFGGTNGIEISRELEGEQPDYEKIWSEVRKYKLMKYKSVGEMNRSVINPAIREVNEKTNIKISVDYERGGRGSKIMAYLLTISYLDDPELEEIRRDDKKEIFVSKTSEKNKKEKNVMSETDKIRALIKITKVLSQENFTDDEIAEIANEAKFDVLKVKQAYDVYSMQTMEIRNSVGWIRKAIRDGYKESMCKKKNRKDFEERSYDYEALEEKYFKN